MSFGFFSNSFFICLGICLVVIGILSFLLSKEVLNQNHKITTMCDLVTTMAQDLQMLKMQQTVDKIQSSIPQSLQIGGNSLTIDNIHDVRSGKDTEENNNNNNNNTIIISGLSSLFNDVSTNPSTNITNKNKIVVSDCDYSDSEDESESDGEDNKNTDADSDAYSDADDEHSSYEDTDDEITDLDIKFKQNNDIFINKEVQEYKDDIPEFCSILSIDEDLGFNLDDPVVIEVINDENNKVFHIDIQSSSHATIEEENSPVIVVSKLPSETTPIKEEELPVPAIISSPNYGNKELMIIDDIVLSSHVNNISTEEVEKSLEEEGSETNYAKMNIQQLRKIVTDRKLATNPTKLKKNELLQLITNETSSTTVDI
jgi:hypothetical protein